MRVHSTRRVNADYVVQVLNDCPGDLRYDKLLQTVPAAQFNYADGGC